VAYFRLSRLAQSDLTHILATSVSQWGSEGRRRYSALLNIAMRKVANNPEALTSRERTDLARGLRSFHLRHAHADEPSAKVRRPVHILYYRAVRPGVVEIVRVLHERMDPARYLREDPKD
jgi:toxin ParE1/3/4